MHVLWSHARQHTLRRKKCLVTLECFPGCAESAVWVTRKNSTTLCKYWLYKHWNKQTCNFSKLTAADSAWQTKCSIDCSPHETEGLGDLSQSYKIFWGLYLNLHNVSVTCYSGQKNNNISLTKSRGGLIATIIYFSSSAWSQNSAVNYS